MYMVWYLIIDHITPNFEYKIFMTSYTGFQLREKFCAGYMETKVLLLSILSFFFSLHLAKSYTSEILYLSTA